MLQNLGDKLKRHKWLGYLVLGPLALIFAAWGAYGVVNTSFGSSSYGLKINDQEFSATTIQNAWQQRLSEIQAQQKTYQNDISFLRVYPIFSIGIGVKLK